MSRWPQEIIASLGDASLPLVWTELWPDSRMADAGSILPESELKQFEHYRHPAARLRFLQGRWLVRKTFAELLRCDVAEVPLEVDGHGRPHCPEPATPDFNLSHTQGAIAAVFCFSHQIGVDVEHTHRKVNRAGIQKRFFAHAEQKWLEGRNDEAFFELWTRKEAMLKASGEGLRGSWVDRATVTEEGGEPEGWRFQTFRICDQVLATVASAPEAGSVKLFHLNAADELEPVREDS